MRASTRLALAAVCNALGAGAAASAAGGADAAAHHLAPGIVWGMACAVIVGTLGQAMFAGLETGLYTVNRVRLRVRSSRTSRPDRAARLLAVEVERLPEVLPALLIGYNLTGALASYGLTVLLTAYGLGRWSLMAVNLMAVTPVMFVAADMLPKELFRADADRLMYAAAWLVRSWRLLLKYTGVLPVVQWLAHGLSRLLVGRGSSEAAGGEFEQSRGHIHALLKEGGAAGGVMSEAQLTLVDRAFGLRESEVADEMIPWSRCRVVQVGWTRDAVMSYIRREPFSRFPVADGGRLVGVVEFVDVCLSDGRPVSQLVKPAVRLAAGVPVRDAMKRLIAEGARMAVVVEGGRPIGLVTMKDLVEPLTGELRAW